MLTTIKCPKCGNEVKADPNVNVFCTGCGTQLTWEGAFEQSVEDADVAINQILKEADEQLDSTATETLQGTQVISPSDEKKRRCPKCGFMNNASLKFCGECGTMLVTDKKKCAGCGHINDAALKFCGECGRLLSESIGIGTPTGIQLQRVAPPITSATSVTQKKPLTQEQKNQYFGFGFIGAIALGMLLMIILDFVFVSYSVDMMGFSMSSGIHSAGFWFLIGLFGGPRGIAFAKAQGQSQSENIALSSAVSNSALLWISSILMLALFAITIWLIVSCVRKAMKKENIVSSKYFFTRLFIMAGCYLLLFVFSFVINGQLAKNRPDASTFTFSWLPILFFAGAFVFAYITLYKPCMQELGKPSAKQVFSTAGASFKNTKAGVFVKKNKKIITIVSVALVGVIIIGSIIGAVVSNNHNNRLNGVWLSESISVGGIDTGLKYQYEFDKENFKYTIDNPLLLQPVVTSGTFKTNGDKIIFTVNGQSTESTWKEEKNAIYIAGVKYMKEIDIAKEAGYEIDKNGVLKNFTGTSPEVTLPSYVKSIGENAFENNKTITKITIASQITTIDSNAFKNCINLKTVMFASNSNITTIGGSTFYNCYNLESIEIPSSVTKLESNCFAYCNNIQKIYLPSNIIEVGYNAFSGWVASQEIHVVGKITEPVAWSSNWSGSATVEWNCNCR